MEENNTCYKVGCPNKPEYEFKTSLGFITNIIVRLCKECAMKAFGTGDETKIENARIKEQT